MITTVNPGLLTTVQDNGRWGYQAYGMPVSGVMDRFAYHVANILVGNEDNAAVLEMTMLGGSFHFDADAWVSVCGADMQGKLNGVNIINWSAFFVAAGSELCFGYAVNGCRTYMAVCGGIDAPLVLGSRSTYVRAGVGGIDGKALRAGAVIKIGNQGTPPGIQRQVDASWIPAYESEIDLRVLLGPQDDLFTQEGIATLFSSNYTIGNEADRMGYRLEGAVVKHTGKADIVSDALCQGAIQVPGHGMPIIMMADRQTTGGYAKIGTVIGPDLAKLAQAKPGDTVRFIRCSDEEAVAALRQEREVYRQIAANLTAANLADGGRRLAVTVNGQMFCVQIMER